MKMKLIKMSLSDFNNFVTEKNPQIVQKGIENDRVGVDDKGRPVFNSTVSFEFLKQEDEDSFFKKDEVLVENNS